MTAKIVLLGGGSHCRVVLDVLEGLGSYEVCDITDLHEKLGTSVYKEWKITLLDSDLENLHSEVGYAFVSHGENLDRRKSLYGLAKRIGYSLPVLTSPHAYVSTDVQLGEGTLVMHRATVNTSASIGANVIVNTGAIVEHDCRIGNHSHIAPGAVLCGGVQVGEMTLVGANSVIIPGLRVGRNVTIGAGSVVVVKDVPDDVVVVGNPARILRSRENR